MFSIASAMPWKQTYLVIPAVEVKWFLFICSFSFVLLISRIPVVFCFMNMTTCTHSGDKKKKNACKFHYQLGAYGMYCFEPVSLSYVVLLYFSCLGASDGWCQWLVLYALRIHHACFVVFVYTRMKTQRNKLKADQCNKCINFHSQPWNREV